MGDVKIDSNVLARLRALQAEKNIENRRDEALRDELIHAHNMAEQLRASTLELRAAFDQSERERNTLVEQLRAAEKERNTLVEQLRAAEKERDDARAALTAAEKERDDARAELAAAEKERDDARAELAAARKRKGFV